MSRKRNFCVDTYKEAQRKLKELKPFIETITKKQYEYARNSDMYFVSKKA